MSSTSTGLTDESRETCSFCLYFGFCVNHKGGVKGINKKLEEVVRVCKIVAVLRLQEQEET